MATTSAMQELVNEKLAAFERLQPEFEACFHFVQLVHGQQRFNKFPLVNAVRYLHSLWVCECKDRLLSIYRNRIANWICCHLQISPARFPRP